MKHRILVSLAVAASIVHSSNALHGEESSGEEIDRTIWSVISRTVVDKDIEGMAATYHPDAVLVTSRGTVRIADQLRDWGQGMEEQRAREETASVSFRFDTRQDGETTAFEAGMFKYTVVDSAGSETSAYVPFEALLVKNDGQWLMVMERQFAAADEAAWEAMQ